jgi:hypothetical protein
MLVFGGQLVNILYNWVLLLGMLDMDFGLQYGTHICVQFYPRIAYFIASVAVFFVRVYVIKFDVQWKRSLCVPRQSLYRFISWNYSCKS